MAINITATAEKRISHSILAFSHQATRAYRYFTKEDFLYMMSDMSIEDIKEDIERFKELEEYEICQKINFVLKEKIKLKNLEIAEITELLS